MNTCPNEKQLRTWLAGGLSAADGLAIETHVVNCPDVCQPLLDSLSGFEDDVPNCGAGVPPSAEADSGTAAPAAAPAGGTPAPQAFPSLPGYDILGELGRGGMGVVFKARHRRMDRIVAIKVLPASVTSDAEAVARFDREVKAAARLHHPNIVAAYDSAEAEGVYFLVMEYVEGADLAAIVKRQGPLTANRAIDCVLQAARGLDYAHRHGVVHRDIKPSNLLLDPEGVVKVLDMGLARLESAVGEEQTALTGMGQIMGTVDFMAPEQALDTRHADARADVYSLGLTLFYLLTGRRAYRGDNTFAKLLAHREQPIPSLRAASPAITPAVEAVFMKMVAKQAEDRYQSMAELIAALQECRAAALRETIENPWAAAEDGLPRPSSRMGTAHQEQSRVGTAHQESSRVGTAHQEQSGGQCPPYGQPPALSNAEKALQVATESAPSDVAPPAAEATVTLDAAELDTDPNTEQSLHVPAGALPPKPRAPRRKLRMAAALVGLAAIAAGVVIRVQTDQGEIVVESDAGGIAVDIERNGQPVKDDWQIHAGADNRTVVRSGTVNVKLPADLQGEFSLDQDTARLVRDGKILVKITRKNKAPAPAVAAEDRDRAAAEWVLAQGGIVGYVNASGNTRTAMALSELPSEPLHVFSIHLWGNKTLADTDLDRFVGLSRLNHLNLGETNIDAAAIARFVKVPSLHVLGVSGTRVKSSDLAGLAPLRKLFAIVLQAGEQNDDGWAGLRALSSLRQVTLYGPASADDIRRLSAVKQLRTIWFAESKTVDEEVVEEFQASNPLCRVLVGAPDTRAIGRDRVSQLVERLRGKGADLEIVEASAPTVRVTSDADLATATVLNIDSVILPPNVSLDEEELLWLSCPCPLWRFGANQATGADRYAAALANQPVLSYVSLLDSDLTDAGLERFATLPSLVDLDVRGTKVTAEGVDKLHAALPLCRIISDYGTFEPVSANKQP